MNETKTPPWAAVCVKLLQGPIYKKDNNDEWKLLEVYRSSVERWFSVIAIKIVMDEADGYAFLSQKEQDENEETKIPRLIKEYPLSEKLSFLCIILHEELRLFDLSQSHYSPLIMKVSEIWDKIEAFSPKSYNQIKDLNDLYTSLNKLVDLTFVFAGKTQGNTADREFEISPIIRAKIDTDFVNEFNERLLRVTGSQNKSEDEQ